MDIFEVLKADHLEARGLLEDIIGLTLDKSEDSVQRKPSEVSDLFQEFVATLTAHNRAEEAVFYEALETLGHNRELAETKTEEHHVVEELLEDLKSIRRTGNDWDVTLGLLKTQFETHVAEEETTIFNSISPLIDEAKSELMAREFIHLKNEQLVAMVPRARAQTSQSPQIRK